MPAQFDQNARMTLTRLAAVTGGATTFAARLVDVFNAFFGPSNPFGTAATANTGTGNGNVPVLDNAGKLDTAVLPNASDTAPGIVQRATSLADTTPGAVATPGQLRGAVQGITQGFRADRVEIHQLQLNTAFETPGPGFLFGMSGGAGGSASGGIAHTNTNGEALTIQYGAATNTGFSASSPTLTIAGGSGGVVRATSFNLIRLDAAAVAANRAPKFAFWRSRNGAAGGRSAVAAGQTVRPVADGAPGNSLLAFFDRTGDFIRMTADGSGGAGQAGSQGHTAGEGGANGFAIYIRVQ